MGSVVKNWALYAVNETLSSVWICTGKLSDDGCLFSLKILMNVFGTVSQTMLREFFIFQGCSTICMTKLRPGVRHSGARPRAQVAAYQYLLVSPNITHNCVGNDSSYSFSVRRLGQLSRLCLLNWSPYGGLLNWHIFPSSPRILFKGDLSMCFQISTPE